MSVTILIGDVREQLRTLPDNSIHCVVTSPPYWGLRDYGVEGQIGLEASPAEFIAVMVGVFEEVRRVLRPDGTCWINMGDSYANDGKWGGSTGGKHVKALHGDTGVGRGKKATGLKPKDLVMMPHRLAIALQDAGWWVRQDIVWAKPNPMPESVTDRCTKSHEYIFLLTKSERYYYDAEAIKETAVCGANGSEFHTGKTGEHQLGRASKKPRGPGNKTHKGTEAYEQGDQKHRTKAGLVAYAVRVRESAPRGSFNGKTEAMAETGQNAFRAVTEMRNKRSVWTITTQPFKEAHFATFPPELPETCIKAGCPVGGTVLDPFFGAGTTGLVADRLQRDCIGIELNQAYAEMARKRIQGDASLLTEVIITPGTQSPTNTIVATAACRVLTWIKRRG